MNTINTLHIAVENKIATYHHREGSIVCGNKDYEIKFTFDEEWNDFSTKTARFRWGDKTHDVTFTGNICSVPVINDATQVIVGVFVKDEISSTPVIIPCKRSILCSS